jgi:hypothetical protein
MCLAYSLVEYNDAASYQSFYQSEASSRRHTALTYLIAGLVFNGLGLAVFAVAPRDPAYVTPAVTSTSVGLMVSGRF